MRQFEGMIDVGRRADILATLIPVFVRGEMRGSQDQAYPPSSFTISAARSSPCSSAVSNQATATALSAGTLWPFR